MEDKNSIITIPLTKDDIDGESYTKNIFIRMMERKKSILTHVVTAFYKPDNKQEERTALQNLSNKINRNSLRLHEMAGLAEVLGYELVLVPKGAAPLDDMEQPVKAASEQLLTATAERVATERKGKPPKLFTPIAGQKISTDNDFVNKYMEGCAIAASINFANVIIAGKNAAVAAEWLQSRLDEGMTPAEEVVLHMVCEAENDVVCKPTRKQT